jgi:ATP-binding cassette, subfamily B, bacterial MsbA
MTIGQKSWIRDVVRLSHLAPPNYRLFSVSIIFICLGSLFEGISLGLLTPLINSLIHGGNVAELSSSRFYHLLSKLMPVTRFHQFFLALLAAILISIILKNLLMYISENIMSQITRDAEHKLRTRIYERYLSFSKIFFDKNKIGDLSDLAINQVVTACFIYRSMHTLILYSLMAIVYSGMMVFISWKLTLMSLALLPCLYVVISVINKKIAAATNHKFIIDQQMNSSMVDTLSNMTLIRSYANEETEKECYQKISLRSSQNLFGIIKKILFAEHSQEIVLAIATSLLIISCVFIFFKNEAISVASFLSFFILLRRFSLSLTHIGNIFSEMPRYTTPLNRILWVFEDEDKQFLKNGSRPFEGLKNKIEFIHVGIEFNGLPILKNFNLTVPKGKMTALVGPTGSGKTTIINLACRFYEVSSGDILYDGISVKEYDWKSLRRKIAIVDQQLSIFNTTIRENIGYGLKRVLSDAELDVIAKQVALYDFVHNLPKRYDTEVGDRGLRLSGGERQRIAIARALLKNPDIFIFDEATSSLDMETEVVIQRTLESIAQGRTMIVIAHRISTIKNADNIVFIENGSVAEQGTFAELLDKKERFYHYWKLHGLNKES